MADDDKKKQIISRSVSKNEGGGSYLYDSISQNDDEEESGTGTGGQTGEIQFRYQDAMALPKRDDMLPADEIRRLLLVHQEIHKDHVDKQKSDREQRAAVKEGRYVAPTVEQQLGMGRGGSGGNSHYKKHPISDRAQFSGIDKQVIGIPSMNESKTNDALQNELQNRLENKNRLTNAPKFNPRPRPPGG
jgi:hypothetical protein